MLDAERKASPFCAGRAIVVNEPEESAGPTPPSLRPTSRGRLFSSRSPGWKSDTCRSRLRLRGRQNSQIQGSRGFSRPDAGVSGGRPLYFAP